MPNLQAVTLVNGVASGANGQVSTIDALLALLAAALPLPTGAATSAAQATNQASLAAILAALGTPMQAGAAIGNTSFGATSSPAITNPSSTLALPATTTAYAAAQLIANSATAGSVVVPSFSIANSGGGALLSRLRLSTNDNTSTAWGGQTIQVDLWSAAPTFTNGDRGAFALATGSASHIGSFTFVMSPEGGDGAYAEAGPTVGNQIALHLAAGASVFWTMTSMSGSGITGASKTFTLTAELLN